MLHLTSIVGNLDEPDVERRVHALEHAGQVETVEVGADDLARRRLRLLGDRGTDIAIALPRDARLRDGAVLLLGERQAVVLRVRAREWLVLTPRDTPTALQLGFLAGHLHWRVEFDGIRLRVALDGEADNYLARIQARLPAGAVVVERPATPTAATPDPHDH